MFRGMSQVAWNHLAYFAKRTGQLTMRVPMPYHVRADPPQVVVRDGFLELTWKWGRQNPLVETERPIRRNQKEVDPFGPARK